MVDCRANLRGYHYGCGAQFYDILACLGTFGLLCCQSKSCLLCLPPLLVSSLTIIDQLFFCSKAAEAFSFLLDQKGKKKSSSLKALPFRHHFKKQALGTSPMLRFFRYADSERFSCHRLSSTTSYYQFENFFFFTYNF